MLCILGKDGATRESGIKMGQDTVGACDLTKFWFSFVLGNAPQVTCSQNNSLLIHHRIHSARILFRCKLSVQKMELSGTAECYFSIKTLHRNLEGMEYGNVQVDKITQRQQIGCTQGNMEKSAARYLVEQQESGERQRKNNEINSSIGIHEDVQLSYIKWHNICMWSMHILSTF